MQEYQHRVCKCGCGKRIPRWTDGKATPKAKLFFDAKCAAYYRRMHPAKPPEWHQGKGRTEIDDSRPIPSALESRLARVEASPRAPLQPKADYEACRACGRQQPIAPGQPTYCNDRCRAYAPLPPRKPDGEWYVVAGPVEYCAACAMAIMPTKPHGYVLPYRGKDGQLYCDPICRKRGPHHRDNEVLSLHDWRTVVSADGVACEVCIPGARDRPSWGRGMHRAQMQEAA
jgi:hypothetical protein